MDPTRSNYYALSYSVPFLSIVVIFGFLSIINRRASTFVHRSILGVEVDEDDGVPSDKPNIKTFLFVPVDDEAISNMQPLRLWIRLVTDLVCSLILAVFVTIIFQNLVLGFASVSEGGNCPTFTADCFPAGRSNQRTNYTCEPGSKANFYSGATFYYCFGFIYSTANAKDVIDTIGICGGLMGVISSIVPLVFYLSRYKACLGLSFSFIVIPLTIIALMIAISRASFIGPEGLSTLAWIVFCLLLFMTLFGWIWGFVKSWQETKPTNKPIEICPFCCCFKDKPKDANWTEQPGCCQKEGCLSFKKLCTTQYKYYPFCCLEKCGIKFKEFGKVHQI